jgi:hypothetical protein
MRRAVSGLIGATSVQRPMAGAGLWIGQRHRHGHVRSLTSNGREIPVPHNPSPYGLRQRS